MSSQRTLPNQPPRGKRRSVRWWVGGMVTAGILIAASIMTDQASAVPSASALDACGTATCGSANAPVTIDLYADFQCPFCRQADAVLQQIADQYVQTGEAKIVYRSFPIIGPESLAAAQAAACAADQSKFWAYGNYLFAHQGAENSGAFSNANLEAFAAQLGLDTQAFDTCLDIGKYASRVQQQMQQGQHLGVTGTPTFSVNGRKYEGVQPYDQLAALIVAGQPH